MMSGLGGIFFRVLTPGPLAAGDSLQLQRQAHPTWTLSRVSDLIYGDPVGVVKGCVRPKWRGTLPELCELAGMEELGVCEYREEAVKFLKARARAALLLAVAAGVCGRLVAGRMK